MKEFFLLAALAGCVFGVCFLADLLFRKLFRSGSQYRTGKSVRMNRHVGGAGVALLAFGLVAMVFGIGEGWFVIAAGAILVLTGLGLTVYYMSFGVYYGEDDFLLCTFGKRKKVYRYEQIKAQQLYISSGGVIIELFMDDGRSVQLQPGMSGVETFMDAAFLAWLRQRGMEVEACGFYDPENNCWFPPVEG